MLGSHISILQVHFQLSKIKYFAIISLKSAHKRFSGVKWDKCRGADKFGA